MAFFILTRFVLVKYSRAFVERPSQGTSSLASRLTTVSLDLDYCNLDHNYFTRICSFQREINGMFPQDLLSLMTLSPGYIKAPQLKCQTLVKCTKT